MDAKLTEIIGINKVNINRRYPALNAIFIRLFPNELFSKSEFISRTMELPSENMERRRSEEFVSDVAPEINTIKVDMCQNFHGFADRVL